MRRRWAIMVWACVWSVAAAASAQTPRCDALPDGERRRARELMETEYLYECCDDTIAGCLERTPTSALAVRLADAVCRRVAAGQDEDRIRRGLSRRARSMVGGGAVAEVDESDAPVVGPADAPVTVVVYACARCPYCSRLVPALYAELTSGTLEGDARMLFRTFPIRGHEGSKEGGLAFVAAQRMGAFWPFLLHAYGHFDTFEPGGQEAWAGELGLDREELGRLMAAPETREALVRSKKEGLVNGVEETPTLFINGRRWSGDLEVEALVDAIAEEALRVRGELCEPPRKH